MRKRAIHFIRSIGRGVYDEARGELEWFLGAEDGIIENYETDIFNFIKSVKNK